MRKLCLCLVLCMVLFRGCHKITYISREDQLAQLTHSTTALPQQSTALQVPEGSDCTDSASGIDSTAPDVTDEPDTHATSASSVTDSSGGTAAPDGEKGTENSKATETTKATESTTAIETTKSTDGTNTTAATSHPSETTLPDSTEPNPTDPSETTSPAVDDPYDISDHTVGSMEYTVHAAMNEQRTAAGVSLLSLDGYLCAIASVRAYEVSQYWSHNRLDGSDWSTILSSYGYGYTTAAENLAQGGTGIGGYVVVSLWAGSEKNLANMVNPAFTRAGVGICDYNGMTYVVCLYAG